jgi:hypothetical protein
MALKTFPLPSSQEQNFSPAALTNQVSLVFVVWLYFGGLVALRRNIYRGAAFSLAGEHR